MDIAVEQLSDLTRKLTITLPQETVKPALDKAYAKANREVTLKGFRRGKVPRSVLEKNFREQIEAEVGEQLVQDSYFNAVEQEKIEPVVHPEITEHRFNEEGGFSYVAMVDIKPEFELGQYKGLEIELPPLVVGDEEIELELGRIQRRQAAVQSAPDGHAIVMDDLVTVDFQGFHDGKAMPEVHNENYLIDMGTNRLGEDFEKKLLGLHQGDKTLYEIDFPTDYPNPVLAGKKVEFKVDVKEVKIRIKPEIDDELAKDVDAKYTGLEDLKSAIREEMLKSREMARQGDLDDKLVVRLIELTPFEVPKRLVNYEIQEMLKQTEENLKRSGLSFESAGIDLKELVDRNRSVAENRVKGDFLLKKIAEVEEIKLADEDIERGYQRVADQYRMTVEEVKGYFTRREELLPFMNELHNEKVLNFLREQAVIVDKAPEVAPEETEEKPAESGE
ncbi:MAG: trigger factor [Desulfobulbaceae bacterium]|nr:trigger factor [Desulfobulbaceae bacterium]